MRQMSKKEKIVFISFLLITIASLCFAQEFAGGSGTEADPYQIATAEHLNNVRNFVDSYFIQTADIDLGVPPWNTGEGWEPINSFRGCYDGNGKVIKNLTINRPDDSFQGLFGLGISPISITKLGLKNVNLTGKDFVAGILAHYSSYTHAAAISYCYVTGIINAQNYASGLASGYANITDSYSTASINLSYERFSSASGLVGFGNVQRSYSTGRIESITRGEKHTGAIAIRHYGDYSHNYWNMETCGQASGISTDPDTPGQTTRQMIQQETFEGFDFETVWRIDEGSYPYLQWQGEQADDHNFPPLLPPIGFEAVSQDRSIELFWNAPDDFFGVPHGYNVYRNGSRINDQLVQAMEYRDTELSNWTIYHYKVTAVYGTEESMPGFLISISPQDFPGGLGTEEEPYLIENAAQLHRIKFFLDSHFLQTSDIDLGVPPWNTGSGWRPIGERSPAGYWDIYLPDFLIAPFRGTYDGNGHNILNLTGNYQQLVGGLFGAVEGAVIKNINLLNVVLDEGVWIGAIAYLAEDSIIKNVNATGSIAATLGAGGISCFSSAEISNSSWKGSITGTSRAGGIVAQNHGSIIGCHSKGDIEVESYERYISIGGIVGHNRGLVSNCYSTAEVTGIGTVSIGGLVGQNQEGKVIRSYSAGEVTGYLYLNIGGSIGGIVGHNRGLVSDCYSIAEVTGIGTGIASIGGLIGKNQEGNVIKSYSTGEVNGNNAKGLIGRMEHGLVENCYWDIMTSGQDESAAGEGRTTEQMTYPYHENTYSDWDFDNIWVKDISGLVNNGYPYLYWQPIPYPDTAQNPVPPDSAKNIPLDLPKLCWSYVESPKHLNPLGFRVYFDTDDEFGEDDFFWVPYIEEQVEYQCADILPERLAAGTKYYWKVVPTTNEPDGLRAESAEQRAESRERRARGVERRAESLERRVSGRSQIDKTSQLTTRNSQLTTRGDAQNVPVWSFTTEGETDIEDSMISCPYVTRLDGNYPNPFNPETTISFSLAEPGNVTIEIYNLKGQKVKTIMTEYIDRGPHKAFWNGRDENNRKVGSGLYFYRMRTQDHTETRRMILLK